MITAMLAQLFAAAGRASQLLSCDGQGRLYTATTDAVRCADTRHVSRDPQVGLLALCLTDLALERCSLCDVEQKDQGKTGATTKELHLADSGLKSITAFSISRDGSYAILAGSATLVRHSHALICVMYLLLSVLVLSCNRTQIASPCY